MQYFTSASLDREQCFNLRHQRTEDHDLSSPSIQRLRIGPTNLNLDTVKRLPPKLEYLDWDLGGETFIDEDALTELFRSPHLKRLLFHFRAGETIIHSLCKCLPHARALEALDLRSNMIGDKGIEILAAGLTQANIQSLNLGFNLITDRGATALANLIGNRDCSLTHLDLNCNLIGNRGGGELARGMESNVLLRSLCLYGNARLDDCFAQDFAHCLETNNDELSTCNLESTQITDLSRINYWLMLNKGGRKILKVEELHVGVWPQFLEGQDQQDGLFYYLSQKPELCSKGLCSKN